MRVLGLIPARGGSKGVPGKNIRLLEGKPLLGYSAESALGAATLSRVILSTDSEEIARIGRQFEIDVPFVRPPELALDKTPTLPVVQHALRWLEERNERYDAVCLLQPTNPFRRSVDIDACIELLEDSGTDTVISILPVPKEYNPHWVFVKNDKNNLELSTGESEPIPRRQDLPAAFHRDGSVYVTKVRTVLEDNSLYGQSVSGYEIDPEYSANIDTEEDWHAVEKRLARSLD